MSESGMEALADRDEGQGVMSLSKTLVCPP